MLVREADLFEHQFDQLIVVRMLPVRMEVDLIVVLPLRGFAQVLLRLFTSCFAVLAGDEVVAFELEAGAWPESVLVSEFGLNLQAFRGMV